MAQRIRDNKRKKDQINSRSVLELNNISFNFKYLTTNKKHNFSYFSDNMRNSHVAYASLIEKMQALSQIDMNQAKINGKIQGCEPMPYKRLSETMQNICAGIEIISKDSSLAVFRFAQNNYRLLCKTDMNHSNLLYVIAFDFDYSAYDHG